MIDLNLPKYNFKIKKGKTNLQIYDEIRRKYITLLPEEWVRQNFIQYLIQELGYPKGLLAVEKSLKVNNLERRADIVVYDKVLNTKLIVECKAPDILINQKVFNQIGAYNIALKVPYLVVTNGIKHLVSYVDFETKNIVFVDKIPHFKEL